SGNLTNNGGFAYDAAADGCADLNGNPVTKFLSQQTGNQTAFTRANVTSEAQYRAIQTAIAMRTESPVPTYIFTIGLGTNATATDLFKQPSKYPSAPNYNKTQPQGQFFSNSRCSGSASPGCKTQLNTAF